MTFSTIRLNKGYIVFCMLLANSLACVTAAPGNLVDSPLFTTNSTPPNVFFEVDDSGSMDWEVMTVKHWQNCAYDKDSNLLTGNWDCGSLRTNGLIRMQPDNNDVEDFEYIYDNDDDAYNNNCTFDRETFFLCDANLQASEWRIRSSAVNVLYYNPEVTYTPWQRGDGTIMNAASFTAARSDPEPNASGYTEQDSLNGFVYNVWEDTHGFSAADGRPRRGTNINRTVGASGLVDLWDKHTRYTVTTPGQIVVEVITYDPESTVNGALNPTIITTTLTGTDTLNGRTIAEVQQNIANWYQYFRRRSFVAKAAIAQVITDNPDYRYGLNFINNTSFPYNGGNTSFVEFPAGNVTVTGNTLLTEGLRRLNWPALGTPLRTGLDRSGRYFDNVDGRTPDPIIEQCQQNFSILFTDGFWNSGESVTAIGDADGDGIGENTGGKTNVTVADIAKFYYDKDLNTSLANNVVGNIFDPATHQHMVTFGVAFGVTGLLSDTDGDGWPGNAPGLAENGNWGNPFSGDPQKIDDLWHASFNSKGTFVSAATPGELSNSLADALSNITDRIGSAASVAFNTTTLTGSSAVFLAQFNSSNNKWSGDILSFPLDPITGDVAGTSNWTAATVLDARVNPVTSRKVFTYNGTDGVPFLWANLTAAQKNDLRINPDASVSNDIKAEARLNFLRGDRSNEEGQGGIYNFRSRSKLLGDIINSDPIFIGKPQLTWPSVSPFPSAKGTDTYDDFKASSAKTREHIIYVGSNDGMLHGFKETDGSEVLAYIPDNIFSNSSASSGLHFLTDVGYTHRYYVDMSLTISDVYIDMGDGIDSSGDSDPLDWHTVLIGGGRAGSRGLFALDITDPTQFVEDTTHAQRLVLWEFDQTDDSDMGFTFSKPVIVMLNNGRWAAIFGNGYNSTGDGQAKLFIVFLDGGLDGVWTLGTDYLEITTEIGSISSGDCSNALSDCNGLSSPQAVDLDGDKVVDRVYAGDLKGNMWVFKLEGGNTGQWGVAYKQGITPKPLFTATHHETLIAGNPPSQISAIPQPITEKPILVKHPDGLGGDPDVLVFFGTGQYLVDGDITNSAVQTFYGVWDNGTKELTPADLIEQEFLSATFINAGTDVSSQVRVLTDNTVDYTGNDNGWMINLTLATGERVIVDPDVRGDLVFFNTWIPDMNPCSAGGSGFLMSVNQINGGRPDEAAFDFDGDGVVDVGDLVYVVTTDADGNEVITTYAPGGQQFTSGLPASSSFLSNKQYTPGTDGGNTIETREVVDLSDTETGRLSWQELRN